MIHLLKYIFKCVIYFFTVREYRNNKRFRTFLKLQFVTANKKRYEPCTVSFDGYIFEIPDILSFLWQYKEIFVDRSYEFNSSGKSKIILDCGANVGLSALFFSIHYPASEIIAFEADPEIAKYLNGNLQRNNISNVKVISKAVWISNDNLEFSADGADGGSVHSPSANKIKVQSVRLKDVIDSYQSVDMLKVDIEGTEREVMNDCKDVLNKVENIFVEYHDFTNDKQYLSQLISILESNSFRYYISGAQGRKLPMQPDSKTNVMDLQLNIFAHKV